MSISEYPKVAGEYETVNKLLTGYSIGRIGDGELKLMTGGCALREPVNAKLAEELCEFALEPDKKCLVGILSMDKNSPKYAGLSRHATRFLTVLSPSVRYYSAHISRPDHAPWIENPEFCGLVQKLWAGKRVTVLCEKRGSIIPVLEKKAKAVYHVECPNYEAYSVAKKLEGNILRGKPEVVIMCAGPTATIMANRLSKRGIQAIDLGSAGKFLGRNLL